MNKRPLMWRMILRPKSLKIFAISFLISPPTIVLLGAVAAIMNAHKYPDSVVPFVLAGLPFAFAGSFAIYSAPAIIISLFTVLCPVFYKSRHTADDATLVVSGASFAIFFGIISGFQTVSVLAGAVVGIISTLVALIATKKLRACDYPAGHAS